MLNMHYDKVNSVVQFFRININVYFITIVYEIISVKAVRKGSLKAINQWNSEFCLKKWNDKI